MKSRTLIILIASVASAALIIGLLSYAVFGSALIRLSALNCSAQIERLERETKKDVTAFQATDFITLKNTSKTEVLVGGDCVSNPPSVTMTKTYTVNTLGGEAINNLEENFATRGVSIDIKRSLFYSSTACNSSYTNLESAEIPNTARNNTFYTATLSTNDKACSTNSKYEKSSASEFGFKSVEKIKVERQLRY